MKTLTATVISCALTGAVLAGNPPGTGQTRVECEDIHLGRSASAALPSTRMALREQLPGRASGKLQDPKVGQSV